MKVAELLTEGFSGFSVSDSDSAFDLHSITERALQAAEKKIRKETGGIAPEVGIQTELVQVAIKELRKGLKDKGNEFNTHGTLNVAMIIDEKFKPFRTIPAWKAFAKEISEKLIVELAKAKTKDSEYNIECADYAKILAKIAA